MPPRYGIRWPVRICGWLSAAWRLTIPTSFPPHRAATWCSRNWRPVFWASARHGILGATVQTGQNGQFFPISRGTVILTNSTDPNAGYGPGPSYLEEFYTTAVHEFGHALGLQHTWTAAAMSQDVIRNTSRARPIDADDIASISELYGTAGWAANTGSISGTVTVNGQPWNMASVVAIPPQGPAVSALTNPDGSYTINGLTPGQYLLYAHPLPPDAVRRTPIPDWRSRWGDGFAICADHGLFSDGLLSRHHRRDAGHHLHGVGGQALTGENFAVCRARQFRSTIS
jgi:hypothetical protein